VASPGSAAGVAAGAGATGRREGAEGSGAMSATRLPEAGKSPDAMGMTARTASAAVPSTSSTVATAGSCRAPGGTSFPAVAGAITQSREPGRLPKTGDNSPELSPPEPGGGAGSAAEGAAADSVESRLPASSSSPGPVSALAVGAARTSHTAAAAPPSNTGRSRRAARPESRSFFTCNTPQVRRSNRDEYFGNSRHRSHTGNWKSRANATFSEYGQLAYYFPAF